MYKAAQFLWVVALTAILSLGCSQGEKSSPVTVDNSDGIAGLVGNEASGVSDSSHILWGIWQFAYDEASCELVPIPLRDSQKHYNITDYISPPKCNDCLKIEILELIPAEHFIKLKISVRNPTPLTVYDVRGIMVTNIDGMHLLNADDYTDLWDDGGDIIINPFRAFATDWPHREIMPNTGHARIYEIEYPTFNDLLDTLLVIDASWPGNCEEPYQITNFKQEILYESVGSTANISVDVLDWQGDVNKVTLIVPEITGGSSKKLLKMDEETWGALLTNVTGAAAGDYKAQLIVNSANSGDLALYDYVTISISANLIPEVVSINPDFSTQGNDLTGVKVSGSGFQGPGAQVKLKMDGEPDIAAEYVMIAEVTTITCDINIPPDAAPGLYDVEVTNGTGLSAVGPELFEVIQAQEFDPVDVTPPWLNFSPYDVCVDGNYAYIAAGLNGLHIFDISDPANPVWVKKVSVSGTAECVISGGYAYVVNGGSLKIIYIGIPESAYIVKSVSVSGAEGVDISAGYAYVAFNTQYSGDGLKIIDIDPPEDAYVVNTIDTSGQPLAVAVSSGYAFVAGAYIDFLIIDIDPPESAHIVNSVDLKTTGNAVTISGGYAYLANWGDGLQIIDIDPPESAYIVSGVETLFVALDVTVADGLAYVADWDGFLIIDVDPPESPYVVNSFELPGYCCGVTVAGEYAYVADKRAGLHVIDINPPESATIVNTVETFGYACAIAKSEGYVYVADKYAGLKIISVDTPESAHLVNLLDIPGYNNDVAVSGDYAYVAANGLQIIDVSVPESANIINTVTGWSEAVEISGEYAYVTGNYGFEIIDIDPPESAYIINTVDLYGFGADVSDGYAYVAAYDLKIIDIDPPESAYIVNTVNVPWDARSVCVSGNYAFVSKDQTGELGTSHRLDIFNMAMPESAYSVKELNIGGGGAAAHGLVVSGAYLYLPSMPGLKIFNVAPPESTYIVETVDTPGRSRDVCLSGEYAYVADGEGGLRIIKLW